jgi:hypothetical protein
MGARRTAARRAVAGLFVAGVLLGGASSGSAASPAVTFSLSCPSVVTPGTEWGCAGTIANLGPQSETHVTVVQEFPGATLLDSSFAEGTCDQESARLTCALGNFAAGDTAQFTVIFAEPTSSISNTAYVSFDEGGSDQDVGRQDTVCANSLAEPPCDPVTGAVVSANDLDDLAGGQVAFDGDDTLATVGKLLKAGQVVTKLEIPFREDFPLGFPATIVEAVDPPDDSCPEGVTCFGDTVQEDLVGEFDAEDPVGAEFRIVLPNGRNEMDIVIYHDGDEVDSCDATPLSELVDACVESRSRKGKVATILVLSTDNGLWDFG